MTAVRSFLASVGVALAGVGLLFVLVPGVASTLPLPRLGVLLLGLFALVQGGRSIQARRRTGLDAAELPEPETRLETGWPGDGFDDRVAAVARRPRRRGVTDRERLEGRLRDAAVEAAAHRWRLTAEAARDKVAAGDWTDDPAAAWFLGDADVPRPPWSVRARALVGSGSAVGFYATRTAAAVVALREGS